MKVTIWSRKIAGDSQVFIGVDAVFNHEGYYELFIHNNRSIRIDKGLWFLAVD